MGIELDIDNPYPDGAERWFARIHTDAGKPRRQESRTRVEAELFVVAVGGTRNWHLRAGMCVKTAILHFLERLPPELEVDSVERYKCDLERWLLGAVGGDAAMSSLTGDDYRRVLYNMHAAGVDNGTCYQTFCALRRFAVDALVCGFTGIEPVSDILAGIDYSPTRVLAVVPNKDQLSLIRAAGGPRTRAVVSLMTIEGMDVAELDRALRQDFDFAADMVFVRHSPALTPPDGTVPGRSVPMSAQTRTDLLRWMATSPGGPADPLFTGNNPGEFALWLGRAQLQAGLYKKRKDGKIVPLFLPKHFTFYAARTAAETGLDLLTLTDRFGFSNTASMHRRVGYLVEAKAHGRRDRALIRKAERAS